MARNVLASLVASDVLQRPAPGAPLRLSARFLDHACSMLRIHPGMTAHQEAARILDTWEPYHNDALAAAPFLSDLLAQQLPYRLGGGVQHGLVLA